LMLWGVSERGRDNSSRMSGSIREHSIAVFRRDPGLEAGFDIVVVAIHDSRGAGSFAWRHGFMDPQKKKKKRKPAGSHWARVLSGRCR